MHTYKYKNTHMQRKINKKSNIHTLMHANNKVTASSLQMDAISCLYYLFTIFFNLPFMFYCIYIKTLNI